MRHSTCLLWEGAPKDMVLDRPALASLSLALGVVLTAREGWWFLPVGLGAPLPCVEPDFASLTS
jgi:hypothetical protein